MREPLVVSVEEAGEMLGICRSHAYELVRMGVIPSVRLGRRIVVPVAALAALVAVEARATAGPSS